MKVQSINSFYVNTYIKKDKSQKQQIPYSFDKISFGHIGVWKESELNILYRSKSDLKELAKYFYLSTESELREVAAIRNFLGIKKDKKSEEAYKRLSDAVNEVRKDKEAMNRLANFLKTKVYLTEAESNGLEDVTKKMEELDRKFESRKEKFFQEANLLSQDDIDYFNRYNNDY